MRIPKQLAAALAALLIAAPAAAQQVLRVIDGDTIALDHQRIRILGMDAPELAHAQCETEQALAVIARDRLAQMLAEGAWITTMGRDRYGRDLAVVRDAAGRDVADRMIAEGLARPYAGRRRQGWC